MLQELDLDLGRVHFFGTVEQSLVVRLLQMSTVHLFLTYPFLISWSVLEALACGCVVLASDTGPAQEIIRDGENGFLVDFFDYSRFAELACQVLDNPTRFESVRKAARQTVLDHFDATKNMIRQIDLLYAVASGSELAPEEIVAI